MEEKDFKKLKEIFRPAIIKLFYTIASSILFFSISATITVMNIKADINNAIRLSIDNAKNVELLYKIKLNKEDFNTIQNTSKELINKETLFLQNQIDDIKLEIRKSKNRNEIKKN